MDFLETCRSISSFFVTENTRILTVRRTHERKNPVTIVVNFLGGLSVRVKRVGASTPASGFAQYLLRKRTSRKSYISSGN